MLSRQRGPPKTAALREVVTLRDPRLKVRRPPSSLYRPRVRIFICIRRTGRGVRAVDRRQDYRTPTSTRLRNQHLPKCHLFPTSRMSPRGVRIYMPPALRCCLARQCGAGWGWQRKASGTSCPASQSLLCSIHTINHGNCLVMTGGYTCHTERERPLPRPWLEQCGGPGWSSGSLAPTPG